MEATAAIGVHPRDGYFSGFDLPISGAPFDMHHLSIALAAVSVLPVSLAIADPGMPSAAELVTGIVPQEDAAPVEEAKAKSPWSGSIGGGLSYTDTGSVTTGINVSANAVRKDSMSTWASAFKYIYNEDDGEIQDNFGIIQSEYDRFLEEGSPWNWFIQVSYQHNGTEAYRDRAKGYGGLGYRISETDTLTWNVKGGLGATWDRLGTEAGTVARTIVGTAATWTITDGVKFAGSTQIENRIEAFESYLLVTEFRLDVALKAMDNLGLYMTLRDEYDSRPGNGDTYNSLWLTIGAAYSF